MQLEPLLAYEASAGSGKTFNLVVRYLSLLFSGAATEQIVALTFTNKAANEMSERINTTLRLLHTPRFSHERALILSRCHMDETAMATKQEELLQSLYKQPPTIMTIDTFLVRILRKFSLYLGLTPTFSVAEQQHDVNVLKHFLQRLLSANDSEALIVLKDLLKVDLPTLLPFFSNLYNRSFELPPYTQTYAPLAPLEADVMAQLTQLDAWINRCEAASQTAKGSFQSKSVKELLSKGFLSRETLNYRTFSKCFTPEADQHFLALKQALQRYFNQYEANLLTSLNRLLQHYTKAKRDVALRDGEIGFDDISYEVYQLFHTIDDRAFIQFRLNQQIAHLLLDEFQDTSTLQYAILKPFMQEIASGSGLLENGTLFFVGDVKQSIYRFRGGASALFHAVAKRFDVHVEPLSVNFRSATHLVDFVNRTFLPKIAGFVEQKSQDGAADGFVEVVIDDDVTQQLLAQVKRLLEHGCEPESIAILCRNNSDVRTAEAVLHSENISAQTESSTLLIHQLNIRAMISLLKYLYFDAPIYAYEFFTLLGSEPFVVSAKIYWDQPLAVTILRLAEQFALLDSTGNMIRFIERISSYQDIESLLFFIESERSSAKKGYGTGVNILTVHKSKGLEFEHVIVMDTLKKGRANSELFLFDYDGVRLKSIFVRQKSRQYVDEAYAKALENEEQLQRSDALNLLYVALTRAKLQLIVVAKSKQSSFELLELSPCQIGLMHSYEQRVAPPQKQSDPLALKWQYYGTQNNLLEQEKQDDQALFGTLLHYVLEVMHTFNHEALDDALRQATDYFARSVTSSMCEEAKRRISLLLAYQPFLELLNEATSIRKEQPLRKNSALYYVDLLIEHDEQVYIIDYKSGSFNNPAHKRQLQHYVSMVGAFQHKPVSGLIVYLLEERIELLAIR